MTQKTKLLALALLLLILLSPSTALAWSSIAAVHHISGKLAYLGFTFILTLAILIPTTNFTKTLWKR